MKWLNEDIELNTSSLLVSIFLFSILSGACSLFTILIYLRIKQLRTVIYRFFFHVAINELISRSTYLIRFLFMEKSIFIFRLTCFLTYLADTNILVLVTFACLGMYLLILKQNTKLAGLFNKISIFLYGFSVIITIVFYILSNNDDDDDEKGKDTDLFRNIICLVFIKDIDNGNVKPVIFTNVIYYVLSLYSFINILLIQIFIKDRANLSNSLGDDETTNDDKKIKSSLKLRAFRIKLSWYPILNFAYVIPLTAYGWIEYRYLNKKDSYQDNMNFLKIRYIFFSIYCFMNSIRGLLFFNVFIMNEKIKIFLFKKFLFFEIFKTIDKIKEAELLRENSNLVIENRTDTLEREITFSHGESFYFTLERKTKKKIKLKKEKKKNEKKEEEDDDEEKGIEMDIAHSNSLKKIGLINDENNDSDSDDDDDDIDVKKKKDIKSEIIKMKKKI